MTTETNIQELPVLRDSSFGLKYQPAVLEMNNYEQMKQIIEEIAKRYDKQVITKELKKSAEESRSELIAIEKSIDEERKAVKRIYNEPLKAYEEKMKELQQTIQKPLNEIRSGLAEVEEGERQERESVLFRYLEAKAEETGLELTEIPDRWLNKGNFTQKGVGSKLAQEIDDTISQKLKEKQQREVNEQVLRTFCQTVEVEPEGWLQMLAYHSPTEIMQLIQDKKKADKERAERIEQQRKELAELEEKNAQALDLDEIAEEERITDIIQVTGTVSQLEALNVWLIENGVEVAAYEPEDEYILDDLPFEHAPLR